MKKEGIGTIILGVLVVGLIVFAFIQYKNINQLNNLNKQLEADKTQLSSEKEQVTTERDTCKTEVQGLDSKLSMLEEDVREIYKGCVTNNACKGHYPGVRWNCNNVGDEVNDPSHICVCDSSCQLNATQI